MTDPAQSSHEGHNPELGRRISAHRGSTTLRNAHVGIALSGALALSTLLWDPLGSGDGPASLLRLGLPALGCVLFVVGLVGFARISTRRVLLHAQGLARAELGRVSVVRFDEIVSLDIALTAVHNAAGGYTRGHIRLELRNGRKVGINPNIEGLGAVVDTLIRRSAPSVVAAVLDRLRSGHEIDSGPLRLTPGGVKHRKRSIAYPNVTRVWEREKNALLGNRTKSVLSIHPEDGDPIVVPAKRVVYRHHLEQIARAMSAPA